MPHVADLWENLAPGDDRVRCHLCAHRCVIAPGRRGVCGVRENLAGTLLTHAYDAVVAQHIDPIEKKPLFHFHPGSRTYSIATAGCNFKCAFCQNWALSQAPQMGAALPAQPASPAQIARAAQAAGCESVAYTYTEPTIFAEYALDTARAAQALGLKNVFVSNGYMTPELVQQMAGLIDAINVDLKAGHGAFYHRLSGAGLEPVLDNLPRLRAAGLWLEVTTLVIPGHNDTDAELRWIAQTLFDRLGPDTPWHVSRFHGQYRMAAVPATPAATLERAWRIGQDVGLRYVYVGNLPTGQAEHTICPGCGAAAITRRGFQILTKRLSGGRCARCGTAIAGVGLAA